jgi:toxin ParE1/3/4
MNKKWRMHAETVAELHATIAWYDEQRPDLGREFLAELQRTLSQLRASPYVSSLDGLAPAEVHVRRRRVQRFPYAVIFVESATEYVVIAVEHLSRQPGYWLTRLNQ